MPQSPLSANTSIAGISAAISRPEVCKSVKMAYHLSIFAREDDDLDLLGSCSIFCIGFGASPILAQKARPWLSSAQDREIALP